MSGLADDYAELEPRTLTDDELVRQMHDDLHDVYREEGVAGVNTLVGRGWTPYDVLSKSLVEGMRIVGAADIKIEGE